MPFWGRYFRKCSWITQCKKSPSQQKGWSFWPQWQSPKSKESNWFPWIQKSYTLKMGPRNNTQKASYGLAQTNNIIFLLCSSHSLNTDFDISYYRNTGWASITQKFKIQNSKILNFWNTYMIPQVENSTPDLRWWVSFKM